MEKAKLSAASRDMGRKGPTRRLRKEGMIPAILYGLGENPQGLVVNSKEFSDLMKGSANFNALIDLNLQSQDQKGVKPVVVMIKAYQIDSITRHVTHLDLLRIDLTAKITVKVVIHLTGKAIGITKGGLVEQIVREIEVRCLPGNIPGSIEVDITNLDLGYSLHLKDVPLPEGIEPVTELDVTIVSVVAPREEEVAVAAVPVEGVLVEGATAEAATGADGEKKPGEKKPAEPKAEKKAEPKAEKKG